MKCINFISALFYSEAKLHSAIIIGRKLSCSQNKFSPHTTKPGGSTGPILFQRSPGQRTFACPEDSCGPCPTATEATVRTVPAVAVIWKKPSDQQQQPSRRWLANLKLSAFGEAAFFLNFHNYMIFISKLRAETISVQVIVC